MPGLSDAKTGSNGTNKLAAMSKNQSEIIMILFFILCENRQTKTE